MRRLHDLAERSGHCYKVKLMLAFLGLGYERIKVDRRRGDNRTPEFLGLSARGLVPVLEDDGEVIWDSQAILAYLGARYGSPDWWPESPDQIAKVMQWLAVAQGEIQLGLQRARAITRTGRAGSLEEAQQIGARALSLLDAQLARQPWLALGRPTVADVACYPYVALAPEGGVSLTPYPAVRGWLASFESLPGFVALPPS